MAKHRRQDKNTARKVAAVSAAAMGSTLLVPATATAAEVTVPGSPVSVNIPGIENVPGIEKIPGIQQWIPSIQSSDSYYGDVRSAIAQVRAIPGATRIPGFAEFLEQVEVDYAPASATYAAPAAAPAPEPIPAPAPVEQKSPGQEIVDIARSKIGSPYAFGAAGPNAFDCSGFTSWVYAQVGKNIPRTSGAQAAAGQQVPLSQIQPGDIVVYYGGASHVAIYAGNGVMIDALNSGSPVAERPLHYMPIHSVVRF